MKLHLGCGKIYIPGYTHVDISKFEHIDIVSDIRNMPMFKDGVADLIYVSATFQYFNRDEGVECLTEWNRILKKGGSLMLSTVDFDQLLKVYEKTQDLKTVIGPLYGKMGKFENDKEISTIYHRTVYTTKEILTMLNNAGFSDIKSYDYRKTIHKDYDDQSQSFFPHLDKQNGIHIMQNWLATK